jgi:hypothetical protein
MWGIINLILTLLGKINEGDSNRYHMYDSAPSIMLAWFRLVNVLCFFVGIVGLSRKLAKTPYNSKFLMRFTVLGTVYFLSLPGTLLLVNYLPPSSRKQIVFFALEVIKNVVNLMLTWMLSSTRSNYSNIKQQTQSFFQ